MKKFLFFCAAAVLFSSCCETAKLTPSFTISQTSLMMGVGATGSIFITSDSDCSFTVTSDNPSVAIASLSEKTITVTGVSEGSATLTVNCPATARYEAVAAKTCTVRVTAATDLSAGGTANSYIVSRAGVYMFNAMVKGSSEQSVGTPVSAVLLWESYGTSEKPSVNSIIATLNYNNGYVTFSTPGVLRNGNAVIAVKDSKGVILWSWHIWVCKDFDPDATAQVYNNNAGTMMDRNLGATSAAKGDVKALGLLYQWGRKDPFLDGNGISSVWQAASTLSWPSGVKSTGSTGTIDYSVRNPTTFIFGNDKNADWYFTEDSTTDNTRWHSGKGSYDPCPAGWRVPDGGSSGVWAIAFGTGRPFESSWDSVNRGMDFGSTEKKLGSGVIWYPAPGYRSISSGALSSVGHESYYWSCSTNGRNACCLGFYENGGITHATADSRSLGFAVRCIKMK